MTPTVTFELFSKVTNEPLLADRLKLAADSPELELVVAVSGVVAEVIVPPEVINAPADVTLAVSVTSAEASMPSNFVPSVARSRPSTVPETVIFPTTSTPVDLVASFSVP